MQLSFSAKQIWGFFMVKLLASTVQVNDFSKIEEGKAGTLILVNPKYEPYIYETQASIVLVNADFVPSKPNPMRL